MDSYSYFADIATSIDTLPQDGIISRTFLKNEHLKALTFGFDAGQPLSEHTSVHPAILHFLQGEADITLGEDKQLAQAGTWVYMPPNLPHSIYARTPVVMLLLMLQEPAK